MKKGQDIESFKLPEVVNTSSSRRIKIRMEREKERWQYFKWKDKEYNNW